MLLPNLDAAAVHDLSETLGIQIDLIEQMPVPGTAFPTTEGWTIHVSSALPQEKQLRTALHELKHVIDHPLRRRGDGAGFSPAEYEYLADAFVKMALGSSPERPEPYESGTERRNSP